uniref:LITAF domain-containing protein n=1 Tax=Mastacembelus armatus TaxID=205130 RepID=A0A3Q3LJT9_9TELE
MSNVLFPLIEIVSVFITQSVSSLVVLSLFYALTVTPLGDSPVQIFCPKCHQTVLTKVDYTPGLLTYLFCGGLFFCGFVLGCCLIPFCVDRLRNAKHTCPTCNTVLGVYKRL